MSKTDIRFIRERFDKGLKFYGKKGIAPQRSTLRAVVPFTANNGIMTFDLKKDASLKHAVEQLLKRNDLFVARAIGLGIMVELDAAKGTAPIYSYPVVSGTALPTGLKGLTDTKAYAIYNGKLSMKTGSTVNFSGFPTAPFLNVPRVQPTTYYNGAAVASLGIAPEFKQENILVELAEEIVLAGTKDQPITLEFPSCTIAAEANCTAYAVLVVEGWLYEGGTTEDNHSSDNPYNDCF
ncbi:MAG: hypothetical protein QM800_12725 [Paludibacter sp.]